MGGAGLRQWEGEGRVASVQAGKNLRREEEGRRGGICEGKVAVRYVT